MKMTQTAPIELIFNIKQKKFIDVVADSYNGHNGPNAVMMRKLQRKGTYSESDKNFLEAKMPLLIHGTVYQLNTEELKYYYRRIKHKKI